MRASRFYYHTRAGRYLLLDWMARHIDQANRIEVRLPARELPETWMPDLGVQLETFWLAPMGRVLDVAGLMGLPVGPGRFSAAITDPICPWNEGAWQFESVDGALRVSRHRDATDCSLGIQALSALIFGTNDPADFAYRGWGDAPAELTPVLRSMFPPALPHLHEYF
jgi:predicted acetyltransferase